MDVLQIIQTRRCIWTRWPTLLTLIMAPILLMMYGRLARWEEERLIEVFGEAYLDYRGRVGGFTPRILW